MTQELLPCPFCGGEAHVYEWDDLGVEPSAPTSFHVACTVCEGGHPPSYNRAEAITAWNTRIAAETASAARVSELEGRIAGLVWELEIERTPKCFSCGATVRENCPRSLNTDCGRQHLGGTRAALAHADDADDAGGVK